MAKGRGLKASRIGMRGNLLLLGMGGILARGFGMFKGAFNFLTQTTKNVGGEVTKLVRTNLVINDTNTGFLNRIRTIVSETWHGITSNLDSFRLATLASFDTLRTRVGTAIDNVKTRIGTAVDNMKTRIGTAVDNMKTRIGTAVDNVKTRIGTAVDNMKTRMGTAIDNVKTRIGTAIDDAKTRIGTAVDNVKTRVGTAIDNAKTRIGTAIDDMKTRVGTAVDNVKTRIGNAVDNVKTRVGQAIDNAKLRIGTAVDNVKTRIGTAVDDMKTRVGTAVDNVKTRVGTAIDDAKLRIGTAVDNVKTRIGTAVDDMKTRVGSAVDNVKTHIGTAVDDMKTRVGSAVDNVRTTFDDYKTKALTKLDDIKAGLGDMARKLGEKVTNAAKSTGNFFGRIGNGIKNAVTDVAKKVKGTTSQLVDAVKTSRVGRAVAAAPGAAKSIGMGTLKRLGNPLILLKDADKIFTGGRIGKELNKVKGVIVRNIIDPLKRSGAGKLVTSVGARLPFIAKAATAVVRAMPVIGAAVEVGYGLYKAVGDFRKYGAKAAGMRLGATAALATGAFFDPTGISSAVASIVTHGVMDAQFKKRFDDKTAEPTKVIVEITKADPLGIHTVSSYTQGNDMGGRQNNPPIEVQVDPVY